MLEHNGRIVKGNGFLVDDLTDHAIRFIDSHRQEPFFIYLPLNTPHSPMQVPEAYWERFKDKEIVTDPVAANAKKQNLIHTRAALAMCENIDDNVGRIIDHLESTGLADRTIVVYFSDNGPNGSRFNAGLRGRKGSTFEGGLRSPCLIRYPDEIRGGTRVRQIAGAIDLLPTLADFAGIDVDIRKPLDGTSIASSLRGDSESPDRFIFSAWNRKFSVRGQRYRFHGTGELYDLETDRGEQNNVADEHPQVAKRMRELLQEWIRNTDPRSSRDEETRPITLGHPKAEYTQLPARDAVPTGNIKRSNRFPNCTYMMNWTSSEDRIVWSVDVLGGGVHEVEMYYACPQESVGTEVTLTLGDESLTAVISEPNEAPVRGMENDRFERAEGYVKDWKSMSLGRMRLSPGQGQLTLSATRMTGREVGEMRLLMFRRVETER